MTGAVAIGSAPATGSDPVAGGAPVTGGRPGPRFSIVIPIHNEAECLADEVTSLVACLDAQSVGFELLLAENGSCDDTLAIGEGLAEVDGRIRAFHVPVPDYGAAMKAGMLAGRGRFVVNFDIDYWDVDFMVSAGELLDHSRAAIVVGSKLMAGAEDKRSPARHAISLGFTTILRVLFDRRMDDTHGMKVLRKEAVEVFAPQTVMTRDLFDTELIIRARRAGVEVAALPVTCEEKREARSPIAARIPRTMKGLMRLRLVLWKEKNAGA